jgi:hypothetical protein
MRASKRILSLVLAVMMAFSVMTAGFINAYAETVPIVPRIPDEAPNPTFIVPGYLNTYGTNLYLPGTNVEPVEKGISFYLDGATNVTLTTTSSVAFGTYYTSGNTMYWDITAAQPMPESMLNLPSHILTTAKPGRQVHIHGFAL